MASNPKTREDDMRGAPQGSREGTEWEGHRGNLPHIPTDATRLAVKTHVAVGTPREIIARLIGCSADTITRHYQDEIDLGLAEANAAVGGTLLQLSTGQLRRQRPDGSVVIEDVDHNVMQRSAQLWLDRRGGPEWRQRQRLGIVPGDPDAPEAPNEEEVKPLKVNVVFVPKALPAPDPE